MSLVPLVFYFPKQMKSFEREDMVPAPKGSAHGGKREITLMQFRRAVIDLHMQIMPFKIILLERAHV